MQKPELIDLSHWQQPRDLMPAKAAGIRAVLVKASQGVGGKDSAYEAHMLKAAEADLLTGAYHFATGEHSGREQAEYFAAHAPGQRVMILDLEKNPSGKSMPLDQAESFVARLAELCPDAQLMVYGGAYLRELKIPGTSTLARLPLWLADYTLFPKQVRPWSDWTIWQYTDGTHGDWPHSFADLGTRDYSVAQEGAIDRLWKVAPATMV